MKKKIIKWIKSKTIKINLSYRDEECRACHQTFRAGEACAGYFQLIGIGYHSIMDRKNIYICTNCSDIIYRLIGIAPAVDLYKAPSKLYTIKALDSKTKARPIAMIINGEHRKYNTEKLLEAVQKFANKMKRKYPWSNVDYFKVAGIKQ